MKLQLIRTLCAMVVIASVSFRPFGLAVAEEARQSRMAGFDAHEGCVREYDGPACPVSFTGGVLWSITSIDETAVRPCSAIHARFSSNTLVSRKCNRYHDKPAAWGAVDYSGCSLIDNSNDHNFVIGWHYNITVFTNGSSAPSDAPDHEELQITLSRHGVRESITIIKQFNCTTSSEGLQEVHSFISIYVELQNSTDSSVSMVLKETAPDSNRGFVGFRPSNYSNCTAASLPETGYLKPIFHPANRSACNCSEPGNCTCVPPFVGNGEVCTSVCPTETDSVYRLQWESTVAGSVANATCCRTCLSSEYATRMCRHDGVWGTIDAVRCENRRFEMLMDRIDTNISVITQEIVNNAVELLCELAVLTSVGMSTNVSIPPGDLNITVQVTRFAVDVLTSGLEQNITDFASGSEEFLTTFSNVLDIRNIVGWNILLREGEGVQNMLDIAERYGLYAARTVMPQRTNATFTRDNIVLMVMMANSSMTESNVVISIDNSSFPVVTLSSEVYTQIALESGGDVPIAVTIMPTMGVFLPNDSSSGLEVTFTSTVVSLQAGGQMETYAALDSTLIPIQFTLPRGDFEGRIAECVFWNYSDPIGTGMWSSFGLTVERSSVSTVTCLSSHLTSFAVLAGVPSSVALTVVSYIGIIISLLCLLFAIIFFLSLRKRLFEEVNNFVHLNLCSSLFLGYLVFTVVGVPKEMVGCIFVSALLHYLFLAVFSWMLCEGIMLYLMLIVVFSSLAKKWWFFLIVGWGLPLLPVIIGLAVRTDQYCTKLSDGFTIDYCWLSTDYGLIWAFWGPLLLISFINAVILVIVLVRIFLVSKERLSRAQEQSGIKHKLAFTLVKAAIILLPLLGITWLFGVLALLLSGDGSLAFAWLFAILNSTQGIFIFIFHVLRTERVKKWIKRKFTSVKSKVITLTEHARDSHAQNVTIHTTEEPVAPSHSVHQDASKPAHVQESEKAKRSDSNDDLDSRPRHSEVAMIRFSATGEIQWLAGSDNEITNSAHSDSESVSEAVALDVAELNGSQSHHGDS